MEDTKIMEKRRRKWKKDEDPLRFMYLRKPGKNETDPPFLSKILFFLSMVDVGMERFLSLVEKWMRARSVRGRNGSISKMLLFSPTFDASVSRKRDVRIEKGFFHR